MRSCATPSPELYARARRLPAEALDVWEHAIRDLLPPGPSIRRVLDLGCGTARFSALLREIYGVPVVGVDPSLRMLAQRGPSVDGLARFVAAHAEALPLDSASVDLVFLSMVYHHLRADDAVAEIARVLGAGGRVIVRNPTRETAGAFEYMRFFPEALALDLERMPARAALVAAFEARGLAGRSHRIVMHPFATSYAEYFTKVSARALSSLQAISDEPLARGLAAFERHCRRAADQAIYEQVEMFLFSR
ncbi:MAG: class I SAM-dependent methyltransferase [Candidatus Rokubacteria bacterium]|nr:class I SAM-dependent methyltransferase [Candidatus Rokubacteria bacterium]